MHGPTGLLRWMIAASVGTTVTAVLFLAMAGMLDGSWVLEAVLRAFPTEQSELVDPCEVAEAVHTPEIIEGTVGYLGAAGFVALSDAAIIGEQGHASPQRVAVSDSGAFRFVARFEEPRPESCPEPAGAERSSPRLLIRAPGCTLRRVSVTRGWTPHRVLLQCEARS